MIYFFAKFSDIGTYTYAYTSKGYEDERILF